ncbi:cytochrome P450 [bacterium]|nr:cytochrome P450 [bacterium]
MRSKCPVVNHGDGSWSVFDHKQTLEVLLNPQAFSNAVSSHLNVPNGMDPPLHGKYRALIDPYFSPQRMDGFEPLVREIALKLVSALPVSSPIEISQGFARQFAMEVQCAFTGWPAPMGFWLREWIANQQIANQAGDRPQLNFLAAQFEAKVSELLQERRLHPQDDVTTRLLHESVDGGNLSDQQLVSIMRNWTVGELSTIASAISIVTHQLCQNPELQNELRRQPQGVPAVIEEILRLTPPLHSNRRLVKRSVRLGGRRLEPGDRVTLLWGWANRDESVFAEADQFRPARDQKQNLLYGAGIHICPGAPLARLELKVVIECLLAATHRFSLSPRHTPVQAPCPATGFDELFVVLEA